MSPHSLPPKHSFISLHSSTRSYPPIQHSGSPHNSPYLPSLQSYQLQIQVSLSGIAHQSVWLASFVSSHSLHHCLSDLCLYVCLLTTFSHHPDFRSSSIRSCCWNKCSPPHYPSLRSATNQACYWSLTLSLLVRQVFCLCLALLYSSSSHLTRSHHLTEKKHFPIPHTFTQITWKLSVPASQGKWEKEPST